MKQASIALGDISSITGHELVVRLHRLVRADRTLSARLLVHLGEMDARGLYRESAYASMFAYCVEELHMSEAEAYLRIHAARLGRQFPLIVELFAQGSLHLTAIKLLVAELAPKPDVASRMRKLPETSPAVAARAQATVAPTSVSAAPPLTSNVEAAQPSCIPRGAAPSVRADPTPFALSAQRPRAASVPLSPGRYKLELTAGQALHDKLEQLKNLLRHQVPSGDLAVIVEIAVDLLVDKTVKQKFAQTRAPKKPRSRRRKLRSRYIPRAVVREVHERDAGQCTFVSSDGKRCTERGFLEFHHHDIPYAKGGEATADNIRLVCRAHNALLAERDFGRMFMRSKLLQAQQRTREPNRELAPELCCPDGEGDATACDTRALADESREMRGHLGAADAARNDPSDLTL